MNTVGKTLDELSYEVDTLRMSIKTILDDQACICWDDEGTLTYFLYYDGYPGAYFAPHTDFANNIEDFTSLPRFAQFLRKILTHDGYERYLLNSPVWCAFGDPATTTTSGEDDDMQLCECAGAGRHRAIEDTTAPARLISLDSYRQKRLPQCSSPTTSA